jgi:hypothetical protein
MARLDKRRRKELLREVKRKEMAAAFDALPISNADFKALFDMLDVRLPHDGCDRTRRLTVAFLRERSLAVDDVLAWLDNNSGFCDCEILGNSEEAWEACKDFQPES